MHLQRTTARNLNKVYDKEDNLQHTLKTPLFISIKPQIISMNIKGHTITTKNLNFIHSITNSQNYKKYLKTKFKWTEEVFHSIDWKAIQTYM